MDITAAPTIGYIIIVLVVILFSMTLHEAMHGFIAYYLGDTTAKEEGRLTLNPVKHIDPFMTIILPILLALAGAPIFGGAKPVPFNPHRIRYHEWGAAFVALAGPLTNLVVAFVAFGLLVVVDPRGQGLGVLLLTTTVVVNLGFFVFNMLPIPPLDGSRFMYALAPEFVRRGMEAIERQGVLVVFAFVLLLSPLITQFMSSVITAIIGIFSFIFGVA